MTKKKSSAIRRPKNAHSIIDTLSGKRNFLETDIEEIIEATRLKLPDGPIKVVNANAAYLEDEKGQDSRRKYLATNLENAATTYESQLRTLAWPLSSKHRILADIQSKADKLLKALDLRRHEGRHAPPSEVHRPLHQEARRIIERVPARRRRHIDIGLIEPILQAVDAVRLLALSARRSKTKFAKEIAAAKRERQATRSSTNTGDIYFRAFVETLMDIFQKSFDAKPSYTIDDGHSGSSVGAKARSAFVRFVISVAKIIELRVSASSVAGYVNRINKSRKLELEGRQARLKKVRSKKRAN